MKFNVINYHITNSCNYKCEYCFGKFRNEADLPLEEAKRVVDNVYRYMANVGCTHGRINLAGGEPLLYRELDELIDYISNKGLDVSLITNACLLTPQQICRWKGKLDTIGISVDSALESVNVSVGRSQSGECLSNSRLLEIASLIRKCGIKLKVNTVVSKFNCNEDMRRLYGELNPNRIKFLQMQIVDNVNVNAKSLVASADEFQAFCLRHRLSAPEIVEEPLGSMQNAYLIISPQGNICLNDNGLFKVYGNCLHDELWDTFKTMPVDLHKFEARYKGAI